MMGKRPKREGPLSTWCWDQEEDQEVWKEAKGNVITANFYLTATVLKTLNIYYLLHLILRRPIR